jgi:PAS domain S-box-containing protein
MAENRDSSDIEQATVELLSNTPQLTNAEIAAELDTRVAIIRDIRERNDISQDIVDTNRDRDRVKNSSDAPPSPLSDSQGTLSTANTEDNILQLIESLHDGVVKIRLDETHSVVCAVSEEFEETFGYDAAEIVGRSLAEFIVPDGHETNILPASRCDRADHSSERTATLMTDTGIREFRYRDVLFEADGDQYAIASFTDITGHKRREVALERQVAELQERNRRLESQRKQFEQFSSILSHDLRNPLNIIEGYLSGIKTDTNTDSVEIMERAVNRMDSMITDTLELKQQSETVQDPEQVPITEAAEDAWELVEADDSLLRITDHFDISCDKDRLSRLLENLFRNAIDHNDCAVTIRVGIHNTMTASTRGNTEKAFYVQDDGSGIPENKREQMFEIGETTQRDGTGLGLPIIRQIADAHGWDVRVTESFDGGAKFIFSGVTIG